MRRILGMTLLMGLLASLASAQFYGYKDEPVPGQSRVATDAKNADVRIDQRLGDFIPMDAAFKDHLGRPVELRELFSTKPVLLLMIFYKCPGVCTDEMTNLVRLTRDFTRDNVGQTFDVVVVSIDPTEDYKLASAKRDMAIDFYNRKGTDAGWHFLTGDKPNIDRLAEAVGFHYHYDSTGKNLVHPAGLMVLSPTGRISRYYLTTEYPAKVVLNSLRDAGKEQVGVRDDRPFFLACIHIDPLTGQRSLNVLNSLKVFGCLTCLVLFGSIAFMSVRYKSSARPTDGGQG